MTPERYINHFAYFYFIYPKLFTMLLSHSNKSILFISSVTVGGLIFNLINVSSVAAFNVTFDNPGFEGTITPVDLNNATGWRGTGDAYIDNTTGFSQVNPVTGNSQALITTGRHTVVDDPNTSISTFNFSGSDPVTATTDSNAASLQDFLGVSPGALSISRSGSADDTLFRTSKEGSGIYQDFTVSFTQADIDTGYNIFELDFNWAYLSNDGVVDSRLGEQDFSFFTVYDTSSSIGDRTIEVLDSSGGTVNVPHSGNDFQDVNTTQYDPNNTYTYISPAITAPGTYNYRVGFGVADVDGLDRTSSLLVDNLGVRQVPFKFSPTGGIAVVLGLIGLHRWQRRFN